MKLKEAIAWAEESLRRCDVPSPKREAELLLSAFLKKDVAELILHPEEEIVDERGFRLWVARRCCKEPLQYIAGETEFFGFRFKVRRGVFIPRPETEILVEELLRWVKGGLVLDLGTGCGNIMISLLALKGDLKGVGVDVSDIALEVAKENARALGVEERAIFLNCDWGHNLKGWFEFDLIVSNPPYIPSSEIWHLDPEVLFYEPVEALNGGEDGLSFYRRTIDLAKSLLKRGGLLAFELGKEEYIDFLELTGFSILSVRRDYMGYKRAVILIKD